MSNNLLLGSTAEGVDSQLETLRKQAVYATLGRLLCDSPERSAEAEYASVNDRHGLWQRYALQLGNRAKIEIPKLLTPERVRHPAFKNVSSWLGSQTIGVLRQESVLRSKFYESAVGYDVAERITMSESEENQLAQRMDQSWREIGSEELQHTPFVLAQLASSVLLNTTLRHHMREEKILSDELQLVS